MLGLHDATKFGKSFLLILSMVVLKTHPKVPYIYFVFVPYELPKLATIKKLKNEGLIAKWYIYFFANDNEGTASSVGIFIGCLATFKKGMICHKIVNWDSPYYSS